MSMKWQAPYPGLKTTSILPNPEFRNEEGLTSEVTPKRALDGTLRTYVKSKPRHKLSWTFILTRPKMIEVREFMRVYFGSQILVTDHDGRRWLGYFMSSPTFRADRRAAPDIQGLRGESNSITIEFEGVEQQ